MVAVLHPRPWSWISSSEFRQYSWNFCSVTLWHMGLRAALVKNIWTILQDQKWIFEKENTPMVSWRKFFQAGWRKIAIWRVPSSRLEVSWWLEDVGWIRWRQKRQDYDYITLDASSYLEQTQETFIPRKRTLNLINYLQGVVYHPLFPARP